MDFDPYKILEVNRSSSVEVIEAAYRALSKKYHPDLNKGPEAGIQMQNLNKALEILRDPASRSKIDSELNKKNKDKTQSVQPNNNYNENQPPPPKNYSAHSNSYNPPPRDNSPPKQGYDWQGFQWENPGDFNNTPKSDSKKEYKSNTNPPPQSNNYSAPSSGYNPPPRGYSPPKQDYDKKGFRGENPINFHSTPKPDSKEEYKTNTIPSSNEPSFPAKETQKPLIVIRGGFLIIAFF